MKLCTGLVPALVCTLFVTMLSPIGCAATAPPTRLIYADDDRFVRLEVTASASRTDLQHPASLDQEELEVLLQHVRAHPRAISPQAPFGYAARPTASDRSRAFSDADAALLSEQIGRGLEKATPLEMVMFFLVHPRDEAIQEITSGAVYLDEDTLHLLLANYRHPTLGTLEIDEARADPLTVLGRPTYEIDPGPSGKLKPRSGFRLLLTELPQHLLYASRPLLKHSDRTGRHQSPSSQEVVPGKKSTVEKLRELEALREEGLVTEEEFERMRGDVLRDF